MNGTENEERADGMAGDRGPPTPPPPSRAGATAMDGKVMKRNVKTLNGGN